MLCENKTIRWHLHPAHLVDPSPWPFLTSLSVIQLPLALLVWWELGIVKYFYFSTLLTISIISLWGYDIIVEGTYEGMHTKMVQRGLFIGMLLFILSEIILFATL